MEQKIRFLSKSLAQNIDMDLMNNQGYDLIQLMELAGQGVAHCIKQIIRNKEKECKRILFLIGPGNNGGDGLVAMRHLRQIQNKEISIEYYSLKPLKEQYKYLEQQLEYQNVKRIEKIECLKEYELIVDGVFGFSFKGPVQEPYLTLIRRLKEEEGRVISIDVPSGWDVDQGRLSLEDTFQPFSLISLTLPKLCSINQNFIHYLTGAFINSHTIQKFNLDPNIFHYQTHSLFTLIYN